MSARFSRAAFMTFASDEELCIDVSVSPLRKADVKIEIKEGSTIYLKIRFGFLWKTRPLGHIEERGFFTSTNDSVESLSAILQDWGSKISLITRPVGHTESYKITVNRRIKGSIKTHTMDEFSLDELCSLLNECTCLWSDFYKEY